MLKLSSAHVYTLWPAAYAHAQMQFFFPRQLDLDHILELYQKLLLQGPQKDALQGKVPYPRKSRPPNTRKVLDVDSNIFGYGPQNRAAQGDLDEEEELVGEDAKSAALGAQFHIFKVDRRNCKLLQHSLKNYKPVFVWMRLHEVLDLFKFELCPFENGIFFLCTELSILVLYESQCTIYFILYIRVLVLIDFV